MKQLKNKKFILIVFAFLAFSLSLLFIVKSGESFKKIFYGQEVFEPNTKIASIDVGGLPEAEAFEKVTDNIESWKERARVQIYYQEKAVLFPLEDIVFDQEKSLRDANRGEANVLHPLAIKHLGHFIAENFPKLEIGEKELLEMESDLAGQLASLPDDLRFSLQPYVNMDPVHYAEISRPRHSFSGELLVLLENAHWVMEPNSRFSFLEKMEEYPMMKDEEANLLSSLLFEAAAKTPLQIAERHIGPEMPDHVPAGTEAFVSREKRLDFQIINPFDEPATVSFRQNDGQLTLLLSGAPYYYEYKVELRNREHFPPRVIKRYTDEMTTGFQVAKTGKPGVKVDIFRIIKDRGEAIDEQKLGTDFYLPVSGEEIHSYNDIYIQEEEMESTNQEQLPEEGSSPESAGEDSQGEEAIH